MARITMLFGYVFNITIVSALVNIIISLKETQVRGYFWSILFPLAAITIILVFMRVPAVHAWGDRLLRKLAGRFIRRERRNSIQLLDYIGDGSIAQIELVTIPEALQGIPLSKTGLKNDNNILVMLIEHKGEKAVPAKADTVFREEDHLTVFGDYNTLCKIFEANELFTND